MGIKENNVRMQIQMHCSMQLQGRLYRNNTGVARYGDARVVYGIGGTAGADLIGWVPFFSFAVAHAVEIKIEPFKRDDRLKGQQNFIKNLNRMGGIGVVCSTLEQYVHYMDRYLRAVGSRRQAEIAGNVHLPFPTQPIWHEF